MLAETILEAQAVIARHDSLRAAARALSIPQGTLSDIANERHEHVSRRTENKVRMALGLPIVAVVEVPVCEDCGSVHTGRCHGKPVALRPVRPRRPVTHWRDLSTSALAGAIRARVAYPY